MPLTGPIPEGHSFFCPRCGALYAVTYSRQWKSIDIGDDDNAARSANKLWLRGVQPTFPPTSLFTDLKMPDRFRERLSTSSSPTFKEQTVDSPTNEKGIDTAQY